MTTGSFETLARNSDWRAVGSVAFAAFIMVTSEFLAIGLLGPLAASFSIASGTAGLMVTTPGIVAAISAPMLALAGRNLDRDVLLKRFAGMVVISNIIVALATTFGMALLGRMVLGVSVGGFWTFSAAISRKLVPPRDGARGTAFILAGLSLGSVFGMPLGTALGLVIGWRGAFAIVAGISAVAWCWQFRALPKVAGDDPVDFGGLLAILRQPSVSTGLMAAALIAAAHFSAYTYVEPFLVRSAGFSSRGLSVVLMAYGMSGVVGTFAAERAASLSIRWAFVAACAGIAISTLLALSLAAMPLAVVAALLLWGAAFGAVPVCVQLWIYHASPAQFESASSLVVTCFQIALAAGSLMGGLALNHAGISGAFVLAAMTALAGATYVAVAKGVPHPQAHGAND